jgi:hypothetical protein
MENEMNKSLKMLSQALEDLNRKSFKLFIPSYQRGYRWTPTEVRQLLDDINEERAGNRYFLQLLAVREDETTHTLRIIDGQQRLTTVLLVLDCLDGGNRSSLIEYETRNTTEGKTLDGYYKSGARKEIEDWLSQKTETQKSEFSQKLIDCEFLYFTIESKDSEFDFFSRLNTWKISATDAELVKCFFLSNDDSAEVEKRAIKWNQMERQLSNDKFWGMFSSNKNVKMDRMEVLLSYAIKTSQDVAARMESLERFPLFEAFKSAEKEGKKKSDLWNSVEITFSFLEKWYGDRATRHLVGWFFHCTDKTIAEAKSVIKVDKDTIANAIKTANYLCGDGKWLEDENLYETLGGDAKKWLFDYLLLANVSWCNERCGVDYDFYRHSLIGSWSIEHVHARNQRMLSEFEFRSLKFREDDIAALWAEYSKMDSKDAASVFLQEKLSEESGYPDEDEDNSLGNLALLPRDANSSLNDKLFRGKQREILSWALQRDDACYWAPPLTVSMFVKEIGCPNDKFRNYWSKDDRKAYSDNIRSFVQEFLQQFYA